MKSFKFIRKAIILTLAVCSLILALTSPSYAAELQGSWRLKSLEGSPVLPSTQITAKFDTSSDPTVSGSAGCNRYFASFSFSIYSIKFSGISSTKMFCSNLDLGQEEKYFRALESATSYNITDQELIIDSPDGSLIYVKAN